MGLGVGVDVDVGVEVEVGSGVTVSRTDRGACACGVRVGEGVAVSTLISPVGIAADGAGVGSEVNVNDTVTTGASNGRKINATNNRSITANRIAFRRTALFSRGS